MAARSSASTLELSDQTGLQSRSTSEALPAAQADPNALMPAPAAHAEEHGIRKLTESDGMEAFGMAVAMFNVLSDFTLVAGPFLKTGLGIIQEIIGIVEQVKENTTSCARFVRTALSIFGSFATAAQESGSPMLPGTSAAILFERVLRTIKTAKNQIEAYAQLPWWKRLLKRDEIQGVVSGCTEDLVRSLLVRIARRDLAPEIRADRASVRSSADANQNTASSPIISTVKEQKDVPNPSPARISDLLNPGVQHGLQLVSRALESELDRRDACKDTQAAADAQGLGDDQLNTRSGRPITSEGRQRLSALDEAMQRLFLSGDSEDLEGSFHDNGEGGDPIAGQNDPAQSALDLLDKLRNPFDSSYSEQTLKRLRKLSDNLDELGLLDEDIMVLQILTALCRRKVIANRNALNWVNLASTLRHLSRSFLKVGRSDEALATSEEAISIIKPMADQEPNRYNVHLAEAFNLAAKCQWQTAEYDAAIKSTVRALDIIQFLHEARPAAFEADLARTLDDYSSRLREAGYHKEVLKAAEEGLALYRSLHKARPAAFEADLAGTLDNHSMLSEAGQHEEVLKAAEVYLPREKYNFVRQRQGYLHGDGQHR
ncbi:unnamed protein product [Tilletia controversa]|nr:unnamed protein product [Tilletia controversa]